MSGMSGMQEEIMVWPLPVGHKKVSKSSMLERSSSSSIESMRRELEKPSARRLSFKDDDEDKALLKDDKRRWRRRVIPEDTMSSPKPGRNLGASKERTKIERRSNEGNRRVSDCRDFEPKTPVTKKSVFRPESAPEKLREEEPIDCAEAPATPENNLAMKKLPTALEQQESYRRCFSAQSHDDKVRSRRRSRRASLVPKINFVDDDDDDDEEDYEALKKRFAAKLPNISAAKPKEHPFLAKKLYRVPYELSQSGILKCGEFVIGPEGAESLTSPTLRSDLIFLDELGRGAGGSVSRALHAPSGVLVAVKKMSIDHDSRRHQMLDELRAFHGLKGSRASFNARITHGIDKNSQQVQDDIEDDYENATSSSSDNKKRTSHRHIVDFFDVYVEPSTSSLCLVLEFMDAGCLSDVQRQTRRHFQRQQKKTFVESLEKLLSRVAHCVLSALAYIHSRRELHRDIKPSNILLKSDGSVKVSDYGCHRRLEADHALASTFTGTLAFMSPERIAGEDYSYGADIWSLGLSIYAAATGDHPYSKHKVYWDIAHAVRRSPAPSLPATFSSKFRHFMDRCLQKDPQKRPSALALLEHPFVRAGRRVDPRVFANVAKPAISKSNLATIVTALKHHHCDLRSFAAQLGLSLDDLQHEINNQQNNFRNDSGCSLSLDTTIREPDRHLSSTRTPTNNMRTSFDSLLSTLDSVGFDPTNNTPP